MKTRLLTLLMALALFTGCAKKVAAPVPGTINTFDAYAARVIGDAQSAITQAKLWEFCSDQKFPPTVSFDNQILPCDPTAGQFPVAGRPFLFKAEQLYDTALAAGQAYHSGASGDTTGLTNALTNLGVAIGQMLSGIGRGH